MTYLPSEPKLRCGDSVTGIELERLLSMIPLILWAVLLFGGDALLRILLSTACVFVLDTAGCYLQNRLLKKRFPPFRLRTAVLGLLLALLSPADLPILLLLAADLLVVVLLQLLGSESNLPLSLPALVGCFLLLFPAARSFPLVVDSEDGKTLAELLRAGDKPALSITDMLLGRMDGNMGEMASLLILLGGAYLLFRRQMSWQIPVAGAVAAAVTACVIAPDTMSVYYFMGAQLFSGAFLLVLIFLASDRTSAPMNGRAGLIYGALYGVLTILLRKYLGMDGALPALLICSILARPLDRLLAPLPFGGRRR